MRQVGNGTDLPAIAADRMDTLEATQGNRSDGR